MKPSSVFKPYLALFVGALSVSTSAILVKWAHAPASVIAFYRLFFTVLLMTPFFIRYIRELKEISCRDWAFSVFSGVLLAFHFILWFESLNYTSVTSSVVLVTLQPLFAFVGGYVFFKEHLTAGALCSALLAIAGSVIISWGDFQVSGKALFGDMLALLACAMVTGYWLFGQELRKRLSLMTYTYIVYGISSFVLFLYVIAFRLPLLSYRKIDWLCFVLLAIVPTLLGHSLMNWSVKWVSAATVSMSILFEPVGASILAYFLLGELIQPSQWIGGIFILTGIGAYLWGENRKGSLPIQESS
ncbi:DMT family transporter [Geobacillus sp. 44B]|jgi:drug/metabolite transporter (DMT)-like permease|uniref:DMT family transporter n=1 Tax=Saccharococcus caldoxylosilyticus TaxID=81408 RepID=UPI00031015CC|nr:DMT family transporter [Parageobacillus caldoxylosilyticus]OQP04948.1 EamA family transporter [Geobacillus sp. 44B]QNU39198.1 DMT family transporter [Geobacillus sp. 44B]